MKKIYLGVVWLLIVVGVIFSSGSREVSATGEEINSGLYQEQSNPDDGIIELNSCNICHEAEHSESRGDLISTVYGQFLGADSIEKSLNELESIHNGQNPRGSTETCYQCHGVVEIANFTSVQDSPKGVKAYDLSAIHSLNLAGPSGLNCTNAYCHEARLDTEHSSRLRADGENYDCIICHGPAGNATAIVYIKAYKDTINQIGSVDNWVCEKCHTPHTGYYYFHNNGTEPNCTKCHSRNLVSEHIPREVNCNQCHKNREPKVLQGVKEGKANCLQCHTKPELHRDTPTDCAGCHGEKAAAMTIEGYDFVKRQEKCLVCHGNHPFQISTVKVEVYGVNYGNFKSVESIYYSSDEIHRNHYKTFSYPLGRSCKKCHGIGMEDSGSGFIACYTCHDQVAHETHYQPSNVAPKTGTTLAPVTTMVADGKDHPEDTNNLVPATLTCLTAECHGSRKTNLRLDNQGKELCLNCHNSPVETVKSFDVHDLPAHHSTTWPVIEDFDLACAVCHNGMTDISKHVGKIDSQGQDMTCFTCHNEKYQSVIDQNQTSCVNCHPIDVTKEKIHSDWRPKHQTRELPSQPAVDCSRCHHVDLVKEHDNRGKNCEACHTSSDSAVVAAIRDGDSRCVACHSSGFEKLHADSTPDCSSCHQEKTEKMTFRGYTFVAKNNACQVCHTQDLNGPQHGELKSVTVNGQVYGKYKEVTSLEFTSKELHQVHYGSARSGLDAECMKCHGTGEAGANTGIIACSACHGTVEHGNHYSPSAINPKTGQSIFAPQIEVADGTENPDNERNFKPVQLTCLTSECHGSSTTNIVLRTSNNDPLCWNCHNSPSAKAKDKAGHGDTVSEHSTSWPQKDNMDCASCHPGMNVISTGHQGVSSSEGLVDCQICHGSQIPNVEVAVTNQAVSCENCHSLHGTVEEIHQVTLPDNCKTCHQDRLDTEHPLHKDDNNQAYTCNTCHKSTNQQVTNAIANRDKRCEACHANAGGHDHPIAADGFAADPQLVTCGKCHGNSEENTGELVKIHQDAATAGKIPDFSCSICHNDEFVGEGKVITNDGAIDMKRGGSNIYCNDCHNGTLAHDMSAKYPAHDGKHGKSKGFGIYKGSYDGLEFDDSKVDCGKCHTSMDTKVVHDPAVHSNVGCNSCHLSENKAVQDVIAGAWSRAVSTTDYTCASCHNTLPYLHQKDHVATSNEKLTCSVCHDGKTVKGPFNPTHGNKVDVADNKVHSDCNTCHGSDNSTVVAFIYGKSGKTNPVYNCEDCHNEQGITSKHKKLHTVTTYLPISNTDCSGCHSKDVTVVHQKAEAGCDVCHGVSPKLEDTKKVILDNLSTNGQPKDFTCQSCHTNAGGHEHPVARNGYAAEQPVSCGKCHGNSAENTGELVKIHQDAAAAKKISNFSCATCHNGNFEGADKVIVQDGTIDMKKDGNTTIYCTDCHNGTLVDASGTKYSAHDGNHINATGYGDYMGSYKDRDDKGVYFDVYFDDTGVNCKKCHGSLVIKVVHNTAVHSNVNCNSCHESKNAEVKAVIAGAWSRADHKSPYTCASCHNTLPYLHKKNHLAQSEDKVACNTCHNGTIVVSVFNAPKDHPTDISSLNLHSTCNLCHDSDIETVTNYIYNNLGQDNAAYNCEACHKEKAPEDVRQIGKHSKLHSVNTFLPGTDESCGECHDKDVTAVHKTAKGTADETSNCDACHTSTPKLVNTLNIIAENISTKTERAGYTCKSCHENAGNHNHAVVANGYGDRGQQECQSCHATNPDGSSEMVLIHQKAADAGKITDFGCDTCHNSTFEGADKIITNDGAIDMKRRGGTPISCVSCHDKYHVNLYPKHDSAMIDTIFEDDNVCSTCHRTNLVAEHSINEVSCDGCHASADSRIRNAISNGITLCWSCHSGHYIQKNPDEEENKPENNDEAHVVEKFASKQVIECADCHDKSMTIEHRKHKDDNGNPLACGVCHKAERERIRNVVNYGSPQCDSCHSIHEDIDTVHKAVYYGFENKLDCSNCHQAELHKEHALHQDDQDKPYDCNVCHKSTKENVKKAIKDRKTSCSECHTEPHTEIDQPHTTDYFKDQELDCSTCHSNLLNKEHEGRDIDGKQGDCNTCHGSKAEQVKNAIVKKNERCDACHQPPHSDVNALIGPHTVDYTTYSFACAGCHSNVLNIEHSKQHKADDKQACVLCHANKDETVKASIKAAQESCKSCHEIHPTPKDAHKLMFKDNKQTQCASCHSIHKKSAWKDKAAQRRDD